jgi:hypothetical protein
LRATTPLCVLRKARGSAARGVLCGDACGGRIGHFRLLAYWQRFCRSQESPKSSVVLPSAPVSCQHRLRSISPSPANVCTPIRPRFRGPLRVRASVQLSCRGAAIVRIRHIATNEVNDWRKSTDSLCDRSLKAWEAIMSSPIHLDDDIDPTVIYAPPWARERILPVAEPPPRSRSDTVVKMSPQKTQAQIQRRPRHDSAAAPACPSSRSYPGAGVQRYRGNPATLDAVLWR